MMSTGTGSTLWMTRGGWKRRMYSGRWPAVRAFKLVCPRRPVSEALAHPLAET